MAKVHLIPRFNNGQGWSICGTRPREGGRLAVHTRIEFNKLPDDERCKNCSAILNDRMACRRGAPHAAG